jgi:Methyltransferase FkbM domain
VRLDPRAISGASGTIPAPDFLKVDVEGYEKFVFLGAKECLSRNLLGIEFETNFNVGPEYPNSHLGTLQEILIPRGFVLFDLNFDRVPRASFRNARQSSGLTPHELGSARNGERPILPRSHLDAAGELKCLLLGEDYAALVARAFEAERAVQDMQAENAKLSNQNTKLSNQNAALEARAFEAERTGQGMLASTSWRIASPLRAIRKLLP